MGSPLAGIVGAPVTPFNDDNSVDYETFGRQVNFLVEQGVSAIAHPMHIGESLNLTDAERRQLATVLVKAAEGRVPTFVHVSFAGTDLSEDLARHCASVGTTGIVMLPPYYWQPTDRNIVDHMVSVAHAHGGQLIAYNNPKATNVSLTIPILRTLLNEIPGLVAVKDASFHMETFTDLCELSLSSDRDLAIYTGIEHLLTSVPIGGQGCFSACSEVAPQLVQSLYQACAAGRIEDARALQFKTRRLLSRLMRTYPSTIKYAMELMDRPVGEVRRPIAKLSDAEKQATREELEALGVFDTEPRGWGEGLQVASAEQSRMPAARA